MKYYFFTFLLLSSAVQSKIVDYVLISDKSPVVFDAKGTPSLLSIVGQKAKGRGQLKITDNILSGNVDVDLNEFDTDLDTRNEHMKEKYLEVNKPGFKISNLKLDAVTLSPEFPMKKKSLVDQKIEGILSLHGVQKKIAGLMSINQNSEDEINGTVNFKIKLSEFGINVPSFAGITVEDEVLVKSVYVAKALVGK